MARSSITLLVILICGNIHNSLNQPLLDKTSMGELMRNIMKRQEEDVVDARKWWLVEPREVDSQMMELIKEKLEGKMLTKTWQKYLSGEPNILQRMTKRYNSNNSNNNNSNNDNINNNDQMTKLYISRMG